MSENRQITVNVWRYNPEQDSEPYLKAYTIPYLPEQSLLHALNYIKENVDATLTYRWSCQMAVCGSCGAMVNSLPKLLCHTFMKEYDGDSLEVGPLNHFPVIKDLVVDASTFLEKLQAVKPYLINKAKRTLAEGENRQKPAALQKFKQYSQCINCLLCYSACPQFARNEAFVGPAALALAHRYNTDSRDAGADERRDVVASEEGAWECTFAGLCSKVCPKSVDPASAIQQLKVGNTVDFALKFVGLKKKNNRIVYGTDESIPSA